jgi:hypothetical protein
MAGVNARLTAHHSPADCFCGETDPIGDYRNDGVAIEFIERAVDAALASKAVAP